MRRARLIAGKQLRELALAGLLLAVPLLFLRANFRGQPETSLIDRLILRVCAPIQSEISDRLLRARQSWHQYVGLAGAARENQQLRKQLEQLQWRLRSAHNAEARLRRYERLLAFRRQRQFAAVGARVIGRFLAPQARGLRISVPELPTELKAGLAVVTPDGVVGRIGRTYSHYADVVLTVDPRSALDIKILPSGARGVLRGMRGSGRGALRIEYVSSSHKISVGDLVVTSGVAGVFPADLPVGKITSVSRASSAVHQRIVVAPAVDASTVDELLVVVAAKPEVFAARTLTDPPAHGVLP